MALPPFLNHHLYSFTYAFYLHLFHIVTTVLLLLFARQCNIEQHLDREIWQARFVALKLHLEFSEKSPLTLAEML